MIIQGSMRYSANGRKKKNAHLYRKKRQSNKMTKGAVAQQGESVALALRRSLVRFQSAPPVKVQVRELKDNSWKN